MWKLWKVETLHARTLLVRSSNILEDSCFNLLLLSLPRSPSAQFMQLVCLWNSKRSKAKEKRCSSFVSCSASSHPTLESIFSFFHLEDYKNSPCKTFHFRLYVERRGALEAAQAWGKDEVQTRIKCSLNIEENIFRSESVKNSDFSDIKKKSSFLVEANKNIPWQRWSLLTT